MLIPENAQAAYAMLVERLEHPEESEFFQDNPQWADMIPAANEVIKFAADRPALLVNDATDKLRIMDRDEKKPGLLFVEWEEARDESDKAKYLKELGDLGFFALLAGVVFWPELTDGERQDVLDALEMADNEAETYGNEPGVADAITITDHEVQRSISSVLARAIMYVAAVKDPINYPAPFLQIGTEEKTADIPQRITDSGPLLRSIRKALNGEWLHSTDLVQDLAERTLQDDEIAGKIRALFVLSGLSLDQQLAG